MEAAWPLAERRQQLVLIAETVRRPRSQALVITGEAGVGKTRLVVEALRQIQRQGVPTKWAVATQAAAGLPFAAVAHLLPEAASATPVELFAQVRRSFDDSFGGRRVVLGLDDAHLLDDASASLVGHLAVSGTAVLLCSQRAGERLPDPVEALLATGAGEVITLAELTAAGVAEVLAGALGGQVDGAAVHRLHRLSSGNPMLLRELFEDARKRSAFRASGELWRLAAGWSPSVLLPDLVRARLSGLPPESQDAAEVLALAEPLEAALLEQLFPSEALAALDDVGLLESLPDQRRHRLRLAHPLYGEVLRGAVQPLRARALHRRLAEALESTGLRRAGDMLRLATWWLAAGQSGREDVFTAAARQAGAMFDHALAERLARAAAQAGGGLGAALALADALHWQGRTREADAVLADWSAEAGGADARSRLAFIGIYGNTAPVQPGVDDLLDKAETLVTDREGLNQLAAVRADLAFGRWRPREALALARPLMSDPGASPDSVVMASETAAGALALMGRTEESLAVAASALGLIRAGDAPVAAILESPLVAECVFAHLVAGRLARSRDLAGDAYAVALENGVAPPRAWFGLLLGLADLLSGSIREALRWAREATELMREYPAAQGAHIRVWGLGVLAEAAALHGEIPVAHEALDEADAILDPRIPVLPRALGRVWALAAAGDFGAARDIALRAAKAAREGGAAAYEALALHDAVRLRVEGAQLSECAGRLAALAGAADGQLFPALAAHAAAVSDGDAAGLDRAAETLAGLGLFRRAAEAAADAARAWGAAPARAPAAARAQELAARCSEVRMPLDLEGSPALTAREREIAALANAGLSSRDIAERLVISVRTVDNHLHRIYTKLGITRRADLPR